MEEIEQGPLVWLREAWKKDPLEVLLPAAAGALFAQALTGVLILRSHHHILLSLTLMALGVSLYKSTGFFLRLARERREGISSEVSSREIQLLFAPLITAIILWGMIAPNMGLGIIFALMSLPHLVLLAHVGKRYTHISVPAPLQELYMIQAALMRARLVFAYAHRLINIYRYSRVQRSRTAAPVTSLDS